MKCVAWILFLSFVVSGGLLGCGPTSKVDTKKLAQSFQGAPGKGDVDQVVAAIDAGDFAKASPILKKVIKAGSLSPEQKEAITSAVAGMQMIASQDPNKYPINVYQGLSDLIAYLEGQEPVAR